MSKWLIDKLKERAQRQLGSQGQILKCADGKPFTQLSWKDALEVCSETDLLLMEKLSEIIVRRTRGGKYIEF